MNRSATTRSERFLERRFWVEQDAQCQHELDAVARRRSPVRSRCRFVLVPWQRRSVRRCIGQPKSGCCGKRCHDLACSWQNRACCIRWSKVVRRPVLRASASAPMIHHSTALNTVIAGMDETAPLREVPMEGSKEVTIKVRRGVRVHVEEGDVPGGTEDIQVSLPRRLKVRVQRQEEAAGKGAGAHTVIIAD